MSRAHLSFVRRATSSLVTIAALAMFAGCRDRAADSAASSTDSSLARDLAMAQQQIAPQTVFNDAPLGGATSAKPAPAAPDPRPAPPKSRAPKPVPSPRRESPPAPVARAPRSTPAPVADQPTATPAPAVAPAPAAGIIGAGSRVGMTTNGRV